MNTTVFDSERQPAFCISADELTEGDIIGSCAGDEVTTATDELHEYLESQIAVFAPSVSFDYVHIAHREFAVVTARQLNQNQVKRLQIELDLGRQLLEAKERLTKRGEFSKFKSALSMTLADARKYIRLATVFGEWQIERIMEIASATNIYSLCQPRFAAVVEKLKEVPTIAADFVKQLVKEARPPRKPKQQQQSTVEWQQDVSGGGRHLNINLYDDPLSVEIKRRSQEQQVTPQHVIADAFRKSKLVEQAQQELKEAVDEMRLVHIEMQRQIIQKDERIKDLESKLSIDKPHLQLESKTRVSVEDFNTWEEIADFVNCDRVQLLDMAKIWSADERQKLSRILAEFLENVQALELVEWIPEKLRDAALHQLSFIVQKITGADNLVDQPEVECIHGCKFISLRDFGTRRERWLFGSSDGRQFPVFGREEFAIERF